ncbi:hypothetical protein LINPERHAP1_LOCUS20761 [Linum perenne]
MMTNDNMEVAICCRVGDEEWTIGQEDSNSNVQEAVSCKGKLFTGLVVVAWWDHLKADIVTYIRAYKLDVETRRLEEVNDLGDRAFIFDYSTSKNSIGHCTSEFGFKRSSIYFISGADSKLYRYNYDDDSVSFSLRSSHRVLQEQICFVQLG